MLKRRHVCHIQVGLVSEPGHYMLGQALEQYVYFVPSDLDRAGDMAMVEAFGMLDPQWPQHSEPFTKGEK